MRKAVSNNDLGVYIITSNVLAASMLIVEANNTRIFSFRLVLKRSENK